MKWSLLDKENRALKKAKYRRTWHKWFAWYPIILQDKSFKVWLEYVETREIWNDPYVRFQWIYRLIEESKNG